MTAWGHLAIQVTCRHGNKKKVRRHHGEDEDKEETVVPLANAAVEEKAVMVVVFNAHFTQLAVFGVVGLKQLRGKTKMS